MIPKQLTIVVDEFYNKRVTYDPPKARMFYDMVKDLKVGDRFGSEAERHDPEWCKYVNYQVVEIQHGDPFYAHLTFSQFTIETFLMLRPDAEGTLTYSAGWTERQPRVEGAVYVKTHGPTGAVPTSTVMTRSDAGTWLNGLSQQGYEVEITDHRARIVTLN